MPSLETLAGALRMNDIFQQSHEFKQLEVAQKVNKGRAKHAPYPLSLNDDADIAAFFIDTTGGSISRTLKLQI